MFLMELNGIEVLNSKNGVINISDRTILRQTIHRRLFVARTIRPRRIVRQRIDLALFELHHISG
jgi:hypothetical protein